MKSIEELEMQIANLEEENAMLYDLLKHMRFVFSFVSEYIKLSKTVKFPKSVNP